MDACEVDSGKMAFQIPDGQGGFEQKSIEIFAAVDKGLECIGEDRGDQEGYALFGKALQEMGGWTSPINSTQAFFIYTKLVEAKGKMMANFQAAASLAAAPDSAASSE